MTYWVGIDTGGTFTDFLALDDQGRVYSAKVPSNPKAPEEVVGAGFQELAEGFDVEPEGFVRDCKVVIHGSTVGLNALIQRTGAKTGLLATEGHEDSIEIRLGHKEDGHRWDFLYPQAVPLVPRNRRLGVRERVIADGTIHRALDEGHLLEQLERLRADGVEAVAISLLWSFVNPTHEMRVAELVERELPGCTISMSSRVLPRIGEYTRTSTTVVNAFVGPAVMKSMERLDGALGEAGFEGELYFMQSNGGVGTRSMLSERPVATLNSGPAGGPTAAMRFGTLLESSDVISVDMGGTSFDICVVKDGLPDVVTDVGVARQRIGVPMVNVTSIGAGGGSIATVGERGLLKVGPESAEAYPGPACYCRGGTEATVTDALVVLGYFSPSALLGGQVPIDASRAADVIQRRVATPLSLDVVEAADGVIRLAAANMVEGIRVASIARGYDPRQFTLVVGGGAGPAFAGEFANALGISRVIIPKPAGVLCAFGGATADLRYDSVSAYAELLSHVDPYELEELFGKLEEEGRRAVGAFQAPGAVRVSRRAEMKYNDQVHTCDVEIPNSLGADGLDDVRERFHARHSDLYAYAERDNEPEFLSVRASTIVERSDQVLQYGGRLKSQSESDERVRSAALGPDGVAMEVSVIDGGAIVADECLYGPLVIEERTTTIVVRDGERIVLNSAGFYALELAGS